jgi:predicted phage terminase large subunit-like protein
MMTVELKPQPGPQEAFLATSADIAIYGGAAGGGKTWALLYNQARNYQDPHHRGVIFRRVMPNITNSGGLLDESMALYAMFGAQLRRAPRLEWRFPSGASVQFSQLQYEADVEQYKGAQFSEVDFDELTEFTERQFFYLLSRLRSSKSRQRPCVRATTNPDAGSWVRKLIDWWIGEDGTPIATRAGVLRWMRREGDAIVWSDEREPGSMSVTFIPARLEDNPALDRADPSYREKLGMLDAVERAKLLGGNWNATRKDGMFKRHAIDERGVPLELLPEGLVWRLRYWDLANTEPHERNPDPDWTASAWGALHVDAEGKETLYLRDVRRARLSGSAKKTWMRSTAEADGVDVEQAIEQEGGSSGSEVVEDYKLVVFAGFACTFDRPTGSKTMRASRWLPLAETGRVKLVQDEPGRVSWASVFLAELATFPHAKRDQVDAVSGLYAKLREPGFYMG